MRLEITHGGDVVYGEDYGAASPAVLGCAAEALGDGHLVSYLPCVASCLTGWVVWAVGGRRGDRRGRFHARRGAPCLVEIFDSDGPGGLRRLLAFGWVQGGSSGDSSYFPRFWVSLPEVIRGVARTTTTTTTTTTQGLRAAVWSGALAFTSQPPEPSGGRPWEAAFGQRHP